MSTGCKTMSGKKKSQELSDGSLNLLKESLCSIIRTSKDKAFKCHSMALIQANDLVTMEKKLDDLFTRFKENFFMSNEALNEESQKSSGSFLEDKDEDFDSLDFDFKVKASSEEDSLEKIGSSFFNNQEDKNLNTGSKKLDDFDFDSNTESIDHIDELFMFEDSKIFKYKNFDNDFDLLS